MADWTWRETVLAIVAVAFVSYFLSTFVDKLHRLTETLAEVRSTLEDISQAVGRIAGDTDEARVELKRLRSGMVGSSPGEKADALREWDRAGVDE